MTSLRNTIVVYYIITPKVDNLLTHWAISTVYSKTFISYFYQLEHY